MIREMTLQDIPECVRVIRTAFATVAEEFHITQENAPRFTAFTTNEEKLHDQYRTEQRKMFVYCQEEKIVGYYSLLLQENAECELNNLSVLPQYRYKGIGAEMIKHAFAQSAVCGCTVIKISIVEENRNLRLWYEKFGFIHVGIWKFDFFPFTCGYMEKQLM